MDWGMEQRAARDQATASSSRVSREEERCRIGNTVALNLARGASVNKPPGQGFRIPVNRYRHEDIPGDEVSKDPEEHHDFAGQPVSPPGHRGCPGNLQRNSNQNNLQRK